ncbi:MAG: flavin-dependent dehydrogenase [Synechococcales bacterium]|nr:flavin-dependent dehydrogenase [Synechococcales bacterium]
MKELLYLEIPCPQTEQVCTWLQQVYQPSQGKKQATLHGLRVQLGGGELSMFVWHLQRTTYLKVFRWADSALASEGAIVQELTQQIRQAFPNHYPAPPQIDLSQQTIFEALAADYPETVKYFQKFPNGEYDLTRVYWWEQRWREGVRNPQQPKQVIFETAAASGTAEPPDYDLIYVGGALGIVHAAVMARLGYRVLLMERLPFGRINREWNISRQEFQSLIDLGLFTPEEFEWVIAAEYKDGFHKFFDGNNPPQARSRVLHTPTVLNIAIDAERFLRLCGEKFTIAGGTIWGETEFQTAQIAGDRVTIAAIDLPTKMQKQVTGRLLVDAMGTASPIAWQLNGGRAFDSVCPTVGAVIADGFEPEVWDSQYGDVLNSHGDISKGRQLIWELFPAEGKELTFYLFHYHQVHPENPGSLLEMYEDFFTILPEYRRCEMEKLVWKKATFGYIPGHFTQSGRDRTVSFDRLVAIGDAASLQSPLIFTGFGSLVRNLGRLTHLLDLCLQHDCLTQNHLSQIRAYQSNVSVTWLFSKGMMVPTGENLPPQQINATLNTFFEVLALQKPEVADRFVKDRASWLEFNAMAITAAQKNLMILAWIWRMTELQDWLRWLGSYFTFGLSAILGLLCSSWLPGWIMQQQAWLEPKFPTLWISLVARAYDLTYGLGQPQKMPKVDWSERFGQGRSQGSPCSYANP